MISVICIISLALMEPLLDYFLKFHSGTHELFEELGRYTKRGGSQEFVEHVLFECASYNSQRQIFFNYFRHVLALDTLEAIHHGSISDKAVFFLGQKQGMLVNDECSSRYNRVGDF